MPPPYRLLIVGYGARGQRWHAHTRDRRDVEVVGVIEPEPTARAAAQAAGLLRWESPADAAGTAAGGGGLHGAIIATPPDRHVDATLACLRAGLGVLVEKPLALSVVSAATVAREAQVTGSPAVVVQNFRYLDRERAIRRIGLNATIGAPIEGVVRSTRSPEAAAGHVAGLADGVLWDFGLHHLDAFVVRFGGSPDRVDARIAGGAGGTVTADLWWPGGTHIDYRHGDTGPGYRYQERLQGPGGWVAVEDQRVTLALGSGRARRIRPGRAPAPDLAVLNELVASLTPGYVSALAASDNLQTIATVEAVARSARLGRPVSVAEVARAAGAR